MAPHRVLVADDEVEFSRAVFRSLQQHGYDCVTAGSGAQAVGLALSRNPDAIVLDLRLRDMTGFEVMKRLREDGRTAAIPVVVVTGEAHASDLLSSAASSGFNVCSFMRKPVDLRRLLAELKRAIEAKPRKKSAEDPWVIQRGDIQIDIRHKTATVGGKRLDLGPKRFETLCALAKSKDGLPNVVLRTLVWGNDDEPINTVARTVRRLRQDLEDACGVDLIVPIPGGYRFQ